MKKIITSLLLSLLVVGWGSVGVAEEDLLQVAPSSKEQLRESFENALQTKDVERILNLFYWKGASEETKSYLKNNVVGELLKENVKSVELELLPEGFQREYIVNGIRHRSNIPILGFIKVKYETRNYSDATSIPYGEKENTFYFTSTVQERIYEPTTEDISLNVTILGNATYPNDDNFEGYYIYLQGGRETQKEFKGNGNEFYAFWGEKILYCEVRKTRGSRPIGLMITEGDVEVFRSPMSESYQPIVYKSQQ